MNWYKQLNKLLGFFWLHVWKQAWLVQMLGKFLSFIVGKNLFYRLQSIQKQLKCISLDTNDHVRYIPVYIDSDSTGSYFGISSANAQFNETTTEITKLLYTKCPDWLQISISDTTIKLQPTYHFQWESGIIKIKTDISNKMMNNTLWAVYRSYSTLLDKFTGIMQLPLQWIYKYPGAIQAAWNIKQNGTNKHNVIELLTAVGGKGSVGQLVYPAIYTQQLPTWINGIHVITQTGILYAKTSDSLSEGYLPLRTSKNGSVSQKYKQKCAERDLAVEIPYAEYSDSIVNHNPAQFIFNKVWGPSAVLIIVPNISGTVEKDLNTAIKFIQKNTVLGTILLVYNTQQELLYPDKDSTNTLLTYYEKYINNNTQSQYEQC